MAKLTLADVVSFVNDVAAALTSKQNNDLIEAALENTLSRDGTTPNAMTADLDLNSQKIINLADPTNGGDAVTKTFGDANYKTGEKGDTGEAGPQGPAGAGSGDVIGPGISTDNAIARYNLATGTSLNNSGILISDTDDLSGIKDITLSGNVDGRDVATDGSKLDGVATGAETNPDVVPQAEAEAGTATTERTWTAQRVKQAIDALAPSSEFTAGTRMLFQQTTAPTGWTKELTHNNKALRLVTGSVGSAGATAFTTVFGSGKTTGNASPGFISHFHNLPTDATPTDGSAETGGSIAGVSDMSTGATGSGSAHSHTLSLNIQYVDFIIGIKD